MVKIKLISKSKTTFTMEQKIAFKSGLLRFLISRSKPNRPIVIELCEIRSTYIRKILDWLHRYYQVNSCA